MESPSASDVEEGVLLTAPSERTRLLRQATSIREHTEKFYTLCPYESIYSFHLFMPPQAHKTHGYACTWILGFALMLLSVNMLMQLGLLWIVGEFVIQEHEEWVNSVVTGTRHPWYQVHKDFARFRQAHSSANASDSVDCSLFERPLCEFRDGTMDCLPHSLRLFAHWEELDTNGDGVWTKIEAEDEAHRKSVQCRYATDVLVLFETTVEALHRQPALQGRMHSLLARREGVHKAYYDFHKAEPILCQYIDEDMCGNLFERGFFTEAIRHGSSMGIGVQNLSSARDFCADLLGNRCRSLLPNTYSIFRENAKQACGKPKFSHVEYRSPDGDPNDWFLKVDFTNRTEFEKWKSWKFTLYLSILLSTFFATMLQEWKDIFRIYLYVLQFPAIEGGVPSPSQRGTVFLVNSMRTVLFFMLLYTGVMFLTSGTDYLGMIFDALSLVFIITIDELLYQTMLRKPMQRRHLESCDVLLNRKSWCISVHAMEMGMFVSLFAFAGLVAYSYQVSELRPIYEALECLCLAEGASCHQASAYNAAWWNNLWLHVIPDAKRAIDLLMG